MSMWAFKRKVAGVGIVVVLVLILVIIAIYLLIPGPSCTNGSQDDNEEGIDCGGVCENQCFIEEPKDPLLLWSQFFRIRSGVYDAGALIENINLEAGAREINYVFRFFNDDDILVAKKEGKTWLLPNSQTFVYEPNLVTGGKTPTRVDFDIRSFAWEVIQEKDPLEIEVIGKKFSREPNPVVRLTLANRSLFEEKGLEVVVLLEHANGNVYAASRTTVENFAGESQKIVSFTWPVSTFDDPINIKPLYRRIFE